MLTSLAARIGSRPRRSLTITLAFVVVAGIIGGPLAGSLKSSGGFAPPGADSQVAQRTLQDAIGREDSPGVVLLVATPQGPRADAARIAAVDRKLSRIPGIVATTAPVAVARDGRHVLVSGTIRTSADDKTVATAAERAFTGDGRVTVGGGAVANEQINANVTKDLGIAEAIAAPLLIVLSIVFFGGRAAFMPLIVGVTTVLGTFVVLSGVNQLYGLMTGPELRPARRAERFVQVRRADAWRNTRARLGRCRSTQGRPLKGFSTRQGEQGPEPSLAGVACGRRACPRPAARA